MVTIVDQHRGVDLEHQEVTVGVERAIDAAIFQADALADGVQCLIMRRAEDRGGVVQKRFFLLLHPGLVGHVGRDVMNLPVVSDAKVVGQDLIADENEPVLPEITIPGTIADVLDHMGDEAVLERVRGEVVKICARFPVYG